jgi:acyl-coenzyme A thioesterase PaaI-like protein
MNPEYGHVDRSDRNSALFGATSPSGVTLCRSCVALAQCRLGLARETLRSDGVVVSEIVCPRDHEGGPDVAHGGWTAGILDEMSGHALLVRDEFAVTGTLMIKFVKPVPVQWPLIGTAAIAHREGRKVTVSCQLELASSGTVVAVSEAIMIKRPPDHFDRHRTWLAGQRCDVGPPDPPTEQEHGAS